MIKSENAAFLSSLGGGVLIALAICFSFAIEAPAHEYKSYTHTGFDINAEDITDAGDTDNIKKLVLHVAKHIDLIRQDENLEGVEKLRERAVFSKLTREQGIFNNGDDIYSIEVTSRGVIGNHGRYQKSLFGKRYDSSVNPVRTLLGPSVPEFSDSVEPECVTYGGSENRVACAVKPLGGVVIAGFDHAEDDPVILSPDCSAFSLSATARQVEDETDPEMKRELLKQYVKEFADLFLKITEQKQPEVRGEGIDLQTRVGLSRVLEEIPCFTSEDFKYGTVYPFVMDPLRGVSIVNVNDFDLQGLSVSLNDPDPIPYDDQGNIESNVLVAFQKVITGGTGNIPADLEDGNSGFVKYHWDDPRTEEDDVKDYIERGVVPGRSVKESYLEVRDITRGIGPIRFFLVFGSGIYPDMEEADDDGGCVLASVDNTSQSGLLNLLLVASVLFSVVFLRKRV